MHLKGSLLSHEEVSNVASYAEICRFSTGLEAIQRLKFCALSQLALGAEIKASKSANFLFFSND